MNSTTKKNKIIHPFLGFLGILGSTFLASFSLYLIYTATMGDISPLILPSVYFVFGSLFLVMEGLASFLLANALSNNSRSFIFHLTAPIAFGFTALLFYFLSKKIFVGLCLLSIVFYVSGFLLFHSLNKGYNKTSSIVRSTSGALVVVALSLLTEFLIRYGFTSSLISEAFTSFKNMVAPALEGALKDVQADTGLLNSALKSFNSMTKSPVTMEQFLHLQSEMFVNSFLISMPAFIVILSNILSYFSASLLYHTRRNLGNGISENRRKLRISPVGLGIFIVSFLIYHVFGIFSGGSVFFAVAMTLCYIYEPFLAVLGIRYLFGKGEKPLLKKPFFVIILILLFLYNPLLMLAFCGANESINQFQKDLEEKFKKGNF